MGKKLKRFQVDVAEALWALARDAIRQECIAHDNGLAFEEHNTRLYRNGIEVSRKAVQELVDRGDYAD